MGWLTDLLKEYPAVAVVKERLAAKEEEMKRLAEENAALNAENTTLKKKLALAEIPDQFTMKNGVLWKRNPEGGYERMPYCPNCKHVMAQMGSFNPHCSKCKIMANDLTPPAK